MNVEDAFNEADADSENPNEHSAYPQASGEGEGYEHLDLLGDVEMEREFEVDVEDDSDTEQEQQHVHMPDDARSHSSNDSKTVEELKEAEYWESKAGPTSDVSILTLVTLLFLFQKRFKLTHTCMTTLFRIIKLSLSIGGSKVKFPAYSRSRKKFTPPPGSEACKRDVCIECEWLFSKDGSDNTCLYCGADRYKTVNGKQKPTKVVWMWDIVQQLKMRISWGGFASRLSPVPLAPDEDKAPNVVKSRIIPQHIRRVINTPAQLGAFVFILALACDGFNPWRGVQYTIWFIALRILNLQQDQTSSVHTQHTQHTQFHTHTTHLVSHPHNLSYIQTADLITVAIICGPREPKTLQYYASDIVEQLLFIQANRVTVPRHVSNNSEPIQMRILAYLVAMIGDFPALCKMLNHQGVGTTSI